MFQDGSGGSPTYSPQSEVPAAPAYRPQSRSRGAPQSGHHVRDRRRASQDTGGSPFPPRGDGSFHPGLRRPRNGSRRPTRGEERPWRPARKGRGLAVPGNPTCGLRSGLNPPVRPSRFHPFSSQRFHALLNSLFKVLFNFPSRYLFAIGLVVVFSLRWSLPPALGCSFKQPDSTEGPFRAPGFGRRASHPPRAVSRVQAGLSRAGSPEGDPPERGIPLAPGSGGSRLHAGLLPVRSHLLRESLLVSFPPLNNMLKLGG